MVRLSEARCWFEPVEEYFAEYTRMLGFVDIANKTSMQMKRKNTIIEKWPYRLRKKFGEAGAAEEFESLIASGVSGYEVYVEWQLA